MSTEKDTFYPSLVDQITLGADPKAKALAEKAFDDYLLDKSKDLIPQDPKPNPTEEPSNETQFQLWDLALNALGTEFTKYKMTGEIKKAEALATLTEEAAARNMRRVIQVYAGDSRLKALEIGGEGADIAIRAARHHLFAARDLAEATNGKAKLAHQNAATLTDSVIQLSRPRTIELFGRDGVSEIAAATPLAFKVRGNSQVAF